MPVESLYHACKLCSAPSLTHLCEPCVDIEEGIYSNPKSAISVLHDMLTSDVLDADNMAALQQLAIATFQIEE